MHTPNRIFGKSVSSSSLSFSILLTSTFFSQDLHLAMAERGYALVSPGVDAVGGGGPALGCEGGCLLEGYDREGRSLGGHHKKSCARCGR